MDVLKKLQGGTPSIVANRDEKILNIGVVLLRPDQINIVAGRVKEILQQTV